MSDESPAQTLARIADMEKWIHLGQTADREAVLTLSEFDWLCSLARRAAETPSPSAALFGFMGWLTSRDEPVGPFSSHHSATHGAELVEAFYKSQGYADPPRDFHKHLKPYPTDVRLTELKDV